MINEKKNNEEGKEKKNIDLPIFIYFYFLSVVYLCKDVISSLWLWEDISKKL